MWLLVILGATFIYLAVKWWQSRHSRGDLHLIPGPSMASLVWDMLRGRAPDPNYIHIALSDMAEKYGPIYKIPAPDRYIVVISGYEGIFQASVKAGKEFGGREAGFRFHTLTRGTGILGNYDLDATWKALRKTTQRHLKQFGEELNKLEQITSSIAEDMFEEFTLMAGVSFNPKDIIYDTALNTIAFLIAGQKVGSGDHLVQMLHDYEQCVMRLGSPSAPIGIWILDLLPWLRFLGLPSWKLFKETRSLEDDIWQTVKDVIEANPSGQSVGKVLIEQVTKSVEAGNAVITETDAKMSVLVLLIDGVATTNRTFYALVNILAHHSSIQDKLAEEIHAVTNDIRDVNLEDKMHLPYARATILEILRYLTVVPIGVPHCSLVTADLLGYTIPANSYIFLNQWSLHHDAEFWGDPFTFRPERFLDQEGEVVGSDQPVRKHLMPFGAGPRVCLGETLAKTRLFLWLTTLIQRFKIQPAQGNLPDTADCRKHQFETGLMPSEYSVIFEKR